MSAHSSGATMLNAIALSSPSGRMSKRARKAAEARLANALFGPGSGFAGFQHVKTPHELRSDRILQLTRRIEDLRRFYPAKCASTRGNCIKREIADAQRELSAMGVRS